MRGQGHRGAGPTLSGPLEARSASGRDEPGAGSHLSAVPAVVAKGYFGGVGSLGGGGEPAYSPEIPEKGKRSAGIGS